MEIKMKKGREGLLLRLDATEERQYMIHEKYEVYEKQGVPLGAGSFHYHNFYEIIYVLEGEFSSMIEEQTYNIKQGDFLLIDRNVMHKYHYIEGKHDSSKRIILWITKEMLEELSLGQADFTECFTRQKARAYHFPIYYQEMLQGYLLKLAMTEVIDGALMGAKPVLDRGYLILFFAYLSGLCGRKEYLFSEEDTESHPLVEQVADYIDQHIAEPIMVDELAEHVHMSKYHFLRKFKELTGVTAHTFVTNKRLIKACLGIKEGMSITQVYQSVGYSDYSSFLRNFKATFGVPPGKYKDFY